MLLKLTGNPRGARYEEVNSKEHDLEFEDKTTIEKYGLKNKMLLTPTEFLKAGVSDMSAMLKITKDNLENGQRPISRIGKKQGQRRW